VFDLRTLRLAAGDSEDLEVQVSLTPYSSGGQRYEPLPPRTPAALRITRLSSGLLFDLALETTLFGPCQRCLEEARVEVSADSREYQASAPDPGAEDEMTTPYLHGELLDLDRWAQDTVVLATPTKIICRESCAGLCPSCGADRNTEACACAEQAVDSRWAALRDLL
jgi:uncharacterized protein